MKSLKLKNTSCNAYRFNVEGKFNPKFSLFETLMSGFCWHCKGAPKIRAMELIDKMEKKIKENFMRAA